MKVRAVHTRIFNEREDLIAFIREHVAHLKEGSVLAITSKIVALAEGRVVSVANNEQKAALIRRESERQIETGTPWMLTVRDGSMVVNGGVDDSNADGKLILLPEDSFKAAEKIRRAIISLHKLKRVGVVITDSRISPLRAGVTGLAVGYAGFKGIRDYRGKKDIFGRKLKVTMTDVADSLATAAALCMGEGAEQQPLAIIEDAPVEFVEKVNKKEIRIPLKDDLFRPLLSPSRSKPTRGGSGTRKRAP